MNEDLTSGTESLMNVARAYFADRYHNPVIKLQEPIDSKLGYRPTLQFKIHDHLTVAVEVSETPYPAILAMKRTDIEDCQAPIAVYCVCPEEAYLESQQDSKRVIKHGFGLITVSRDGQAELRSGCIPLLQRIPQQEFTDSLVGLPPRIKRRLTEAFERYLGNAPSGAADMAEVLEGFVLQAGRDALKRGWITAGQAKPGFSASTLDAFVGVNSMQPATAAIAGARSYISEYRNLSHHFPKNKKMAAKKYRDCRHAFRDGLRKVKVFREAVKLCGLSGGLPS